MNSKINIQELSKNQEAIRIYTKEETLNFQKIRELLQNIDYTYESKNTNNLETIITELSNKLNKINNIHQNNLTIIEKNIIKYKNIKQKTENIFDNLIK